MCGFCILYELMNQSKVKSLTLLFYKGFWALLHKFILSVWLSFMLAEDEDVPVDRRPVLSAVSNDAVKVPAMASVTTLFFPVFTHPVFSRVQSWQLHIIIIIIGKHHCSDICGVSPAYHSFCGLIHFLSPKKKKEKSQPNFVFYEFQSNNVTKEALISEHSFEKTQNPHVQAQHKKTTCKYIEKTYNFSTSVMCSADYNNFCTLVLKTASPMFRLKGATITCRVRIIGSNSLVRVLLPETYYVNDATSLYQCFLVL